jgi:hypothetical protein
MPHLAGFFEGNLQRLLGLWGEFDLSACVTALAADAQDHFADAFGIQAEFAQDAPGHTAFFFEQAEQQVLGADQSLVGAFGLLVSQGEHAPRPLGEFFHAGHKGLPQDKFRLVLQSDKKCLF